MTSAKLIVLGDKSVGKTSIITRLAGNPFNEHEKATVGVNFRIQILQKDGQVMSITIWDTVGQEKYRSIVRLYYRDVTIAVVVFALDDEESFQHLEGWINEFKSVSGEDAIIIIVGNKSDRLESRRVEVDQVKAWAESSNYSFVVTSAKTSDGIEELLDMITESAQMSQRLQREEHQIVESSKSCKC